MFGNTHREELMAGFATENTGCNSISQDVHVIINRQNE